MSSDLVVFTLVGGAVYADTHSVGQVGISMPMIAATLAGVVLGNVSLGMTVGILIQLPYLIEIPVGSAKTSISSLGAYVAAGLAVFLESSFPIRPNLVLLTAVLAAIAVGWTTIPLQDQLRRWNLHLTKQGDLAAERGDIKRIDHLNFAAAGGAFVFGAMASLGWLILVLTICKRIIAWIPQSLEARLQFFAPVLLGAGVACLISQLIRSRGFPFYPLTGMALGGLFFLVKWVV